MKKNSATASSVANSVSCLAQVTLLHKNTALPQEIIVFLEKYTALPPLVLRKKITYEHDVLQHSSGKSILYRAQLYPYDTLDKAEKYLQNILAMEFPHELNSKDFVKHMQQVAQHCHEHKKFAKKMLKAYLDEDESFYQEQAEISSEFAFMCYFLAHFTFMPFFAYTRGQVQVQHETEIWPHGHCPYCGGAPQLSYLKEKEGKRVHTCSVCQALYRTARIACPYCQEQRQEKLKYFTAKEVKDAQVCVCTTCKNYIKICDLREYEKFAPLPLVDDFKTLLLDLVAIQQGYENPVVSLWLN